MITYSATHSAASLNPGVKAEGSHHDVDAPQGSVQVRPRARSPPPLPERHRLRAVRMPALVTTKPARKARPPPFAVIPEKVIILARTVRWKYEGNGCRVLGGAALRAAMRVIVSPWPRLPCACGEAIGR
jgi:hypothetical protein